MDVHVDAMDVAGENHMDIDHDMWKQRLDPEGNNIGERFKEVVSASAHRNIERSGCHQSGYVCTLVYYYTSK